MIADKLQLVKLRLPNWAGVAVVVQLLKVMCCQSRFLYSWNLGPDYQLIALGLANVDVGLGGSLKTANLIYALYAPVHHHLKQQRMIRVGGIKMAWLAQWTMHVHFGKRGFQFLFHQPFENWIHHYCHFDGILSLFDLVK